MVPLTLLVPGLLFGAIYSGEFLVLSTKIFSFRRNFIQMQESRTHADSAAITKLHA